MAAVRVARCGPGRPRTRPVRVVADKGYSSRKIRAYLRQRGIAATIPERIDQRAGRRRRGERLCGFAPGIYRRRNVVECCFNRLKQNKALATRYDKRARHYQAMVTLACLPVAEGGELGILLVWAGCYELRHCGWRRSPGYGSLPFSGC